MQFSNDGINFSNLTDNSMDLNYFERINGDYNSEIETRDMKLKVCLSGDIANSNKYFIVKYKTLCQEYIDTFNIFYGFYNTPNPCDTISNGGQYAGSYFLTESDSIYTHLDSLGSVLLDTLVKIDSSLVTDDTIRICNLENSLLITMDKPCWANENDNLSYQWQYNSSGFWYDFYGDTSETFSLNESYEVYFSNYCLDVRRIVKFIDPYCSNNINFSSDTVTVIYRLPTGTYSNVISEVNAPCENEYLTLTLNRYGWPYYDPYQCDSSFFSTLDSTDFIVDSLAIRFTLGSLQIDITDSVDISTSSPLYLFLDSGILNFQYNLIYNFFPGTFQDGDILKMYVDAYALGCVNSDIYVLQKKLSITPLNAGHIETTDTICFGSLEDTLVLNNTDFFNTGSDSQGYVWEYSYAANFSDSIRLSNETDSTLIIPASIFNNLEDSLYVRRVYFGNSYCTGPAYSNTAVITNACYEDSCTNCCFDLELLSVECASQGANTPELCDDQWTFWITTVESTAPGSYVNIYVDGVYTTSVSYNTQKQVGFFNYSSFPNPVTVSVCDNLDPSCCQSLVVTPPPFGSCSPTCEGFGYANYITRCFNDTLILCYDIVGSNGQCWATSIKVLDDANHHGIHASYGVGDQVAVCDTFYGLELDSIQTFNPNHVLLWGMICNTWNNPSCPEYPGYSECIIDYSIPYSCCIDSGITVEVNCNYPYATLTAYYNGVLMDPSEYQLQWQVADMMFSPSQNPFTVVNEFGSEYSVRIEDELGINLLCDGSITGIISCNEPCNGNTPDGLKCLKTEKQGTQLYWNPVPNALSYEVLLTFNDSRCCKKEEKIYTHIISCANNFINPPNFASCYSWQVRALCADGYTEYSSYLCTCDDIPCQLSTPSFLDCKVMDEQYNLTWLPVLNAAYYQVSIVYDDPSCCKSDGISAKKTFTTSSPNMSLSLKNACFSWRVRAICNNGTKSYWSNLECSCADHKAKEQNKEVAIQNESKINLSVKPNPVQNEISFYIEDNESQFNNKELSLVIYDLNGKEVFRAQLEANLPNNFELGYLHSGLYFYQVKVNGALQWTNKIIME